MLLNFYDPIKAKRYFEGGLQLQQKVDLEKRDQPKERDKTLKSLFLAPPKIVFAELISETHFQNKRALFLFYDQF